MSESMPIIMNHGMSAEQVDDARRRWGVDEFPELPSELAAVWAAIDPRGPLDLAVVASVVAWVRDVAAPGGPVLVQGEAGVTHAVVDRLQALGYLPVYATTAREVMETPLPDGRTETRRVFRHVQFRAYPGADEHGRSRDGHGPAQEDRDD